MSEYVTNRELHAELQAIRSDAADMGERLARLETWVKWLGPVLLGAVLAPKVGGPEIGEALAGAAHAVFTAWSAL